MVNQYALAYANLLNDLIKQKSAEEPASTSFMSNIASSREHAIQSEKDRILKANQFLMQQEMIKDLREEKKQQYNEKKQQSASETSDAKKLSNTLNAFRTINTVVGEMKHLLSTPQAKTDFYNIKKLVENNRNKNVIERTVDKKLYDYDPSKATSKTEEVTMLFDYLMKRDSGNKENYKRMKELWTGIAANAKILSGFETKSLGQQSKSAFDTFVSSFTQRLLTSESLEKFLNEDVKSFILPIAEDIKAQGEGIESTERELGVESTASKEYKKVLPAIEVYFPHAGDLGETIQQDIQEGKKDGSVTEIFNSDKVNNNNNDEDLLKGYSEEGRKKVMDYAQKNKMTVKQVFEEFSE